MKSHAWLANFALFITIILIFWSIHHWEKSPPLGSQGFQSGSARFSPDWKLPLLTTAQSSSGGDTTISSRDFDQRLLFINFWASWCEACKQEEPELMKLWESLDATRVAMVGIASLDRKEAVLKSELVGKAFPIALDESGHVLSAFNANSLPQSFLLDSEGRILMHFKEAITEYDRLTLLERLLMLGIKAKD